MTEGISKAPDRASKAMITAGWSMGSHNILQRVVEPSVHHVQNPDERLGFVQVPIRVQGRGGHWRVQSQGSLQYARVNRRGIGRGCLRDDARGTLPPPPYRWRWGDLPQFFFNFSLCL